MIAQDNAELIERYWQQIANYWKIKNVDWYKENTAFHRQIWLSCSEIVRATDYKFNSGQALETVDLQVQPIKLALGKIWFAGGSMVVRGILHQHEGEYHLPHAKAIAMQFKDMWEGDYDEVHIFDYIETIVVDACASQMINVTCIRALVDILEGDLDGICLLPQDQNILN